MACNDDEQIMFDKAAVDVLAPDGNFSVYPYYILEMMDRSLRDLLNSGHDLGVERAARIVLQAAKGLDFAYHQGLLCA